MELPRKADCHMSDLAAEYCPLRVEPRVLEQITTLWTRRLPVRWRAEFYSHPMWRNLPMHRRSGFRDRIVRGLRGLSFDRALLLAFAVTSLSLLGLGLLPPAGKTNIAGNSASPASITGLDPKSIRLGFAADRNR
jgi:hypothetical protein